MQEQLKQPLFCLLDNNNAFAGTRHCTGYTDDIVLNVNVCNLQVLNGNLLVTHLTSHFLALEDVLRVH